MKSVQAARRNGRSGFHHLRVEFEQQPLEVLLDAAQPAAIGEAATAVLLDVFEQHARRACPCIIGAKPQRRVVCDTRRQFGDGAEVCMGLLRKRSLRHSLVMGDPDLGDGASPLDVTRLGPRLLETTLGEVERACHAKFDTVSVKCRTFGSARRTVDPALPPRDPGPHRSTRPRSSPAPPVRTHPSPTTTPPLRTPLATLRQGWFRHA